MKEKRALLVVGSPRGMEKSTSGRLGGQLLAALAERGFATDRLHVHAAVATPEGMDAALAAVGAADLVVLSAPLYVDSFPAPAIALLEEVVKRRAGAGRAALFVLVQCGFPEREQNDTAIAIAERFATDAGWRWIGSAAFGGVDVYGGGIPDALITMAEAIAGDVPIPVVRVKRAMPAWLYRLGGNLMWRRVARKQGSARRLGARPYEEP